MLKKSLSLLAVLMFGFIGTAMAEEPEVLTTEIQEVQEVQGTQQDKKAIIIGDRDGIPGQAIAECAVSAGAEVVFSSTECFV